MLGVGLGPRRTFEAQALELRQRLVPTEAPRLGEEGGSERDAVREHRQEECLDVGRLHEVASVEQRSGPGDPLQCEARADGAADDVSSISRVARTRAMIQRRITAST